MAPGYTICFLRRGAELLLLNRRRRPAMGLWTGVGGKIEAGEGPMAGVLREVREETGISLPTARLAGVVSWNLEEGRDGMYAYVAELPPDFPYPAPRLTEEGLLAWQRLSWVLDVDNAGVARHVRLALPALLFGDACDDHRFTFARGAQSTDWTILTYQRVPWRPDGPREVSGA